MTSLTQKLTKIEQFQKASEKHGYIFFNLKSPLNLNIIGVRSSSTEANSFDDLVVLIYSENGYPVLKKFPATTDPGNYWLKKPMRVEGTAIVVPGQYRGAYRVGLHHDTEALVQSKPLKVYRDSNRDTVLDFDPSTIQTGHFGINIHGESVNLDSTVVEKWSAGCQVLQYNDDLAELVSTCKRSARLYGPNFTYTLLEEKDFDS